MLVFHFGVFFGTYIFEVHSATGLVDYDHFVFNENKSNLAFDLQGLERKKIMIHLICFEKVLL